LRDWSSYQEERRHLKSPQPNLLSRRAISQSSLILIPETENIVNRPPPILPRRTISQNNLPLLFSRRSLVVSVVFQVRSHAWDKDGIMINKRWRYLNIETFMIIIWLDSDLLGLQYLFTITTLIYYQVSLCFKKF
jgi:hypothetical protein